MGCPSGDGGCWRRSRCKVFSGVSTMSKRVCSSRSGLVPRMLRAPLAFPTCQSWSGVWLEMLQLCSCKVALSRTCEFWTQSRHSLVGRIFGHFTNAGPKSHGSRAPRTQSRNWDWLAKFRELAISLSVGQNRRACTDNGVFASSFCEASCVFCYFATFCAQRLSCGETIGSFWFSHPLPYAYHARIASSTFCTSAPKPRLGIWDCTVCIFPCSLCY